MDATEVAAAAVPAADTPKRVIRTGSVHGPYAAGACDMCHVTSTSGGFKGLGRRSDAATAPARPSVVPGGGFVVPMGELCTGCHESKSPPEARKEGLWVHTPVGSGACIKCHRPHSGTQPSLLTKAGGESCLECHKAGQNAGKGAHRQTENCLDCHNAHFGKDRRLLTANYREPW